MASSTIIPTNFYEKLRLRVNVSDVVRKKVMLSRRGNEYNGLCPFHSEKTPSFTVNDAKHFYHCFGCGAHGDAIKFVSETTGFSYKEAAIYIAKDFGIEIPQFSKKEKEQYAEEEYLMNITAQAHKFFQSNLNAYTQKYFNDRGIGDEIIKEFELGYSPGQGALIKHFKEKSVKLDFLIKAGLIRKNDNGKIYELFNNRVIFPIRNIYNKIVGFGGRVLDDSLPKYLNSPETVFFKKSEIMYGENFAASAAHRNNRSILVEGYMDVIALQSVGYKETVAALGTAVTELHLLKLWRFGNEIIVCLDGDSAGVRASRKLISTCLPHISHNRRISFIKLQNGLDPDDFIKQMGKDKFDQAIDSRISLSNQILQNELEGINLEIAEDKAKLEQKLYEHVKIIKDPSLAKNFQLYFKNQLWNLTKISRQKTSHNSNYYKQKNTAPVAKNYSNCEILEKSIIALIIRYPIILNDTKILDELKSINFTCKDLVDVFDWLLDISIASYSLTKITIVDMAKNSGFFEIISLLSEHGQVFLEFEYIDKNMENAPTILLLLIKKHFLEQLKKEYSEVAKSGLASTEARSRHYINEIQRASLEIQNITNSFTN